MKSNFEYAPVLIPTLCRYEHFSKLIDSLKLCEEAKYTELVIGLDYPPHEKYTIGWKKIKEFIPTITGFKKVTVFEAARNLGVDENSEVIINYVKEKGYRFFIYTEDDNVFAPNFLSFMNWGLRKYHYNSNVLAICGYNYPINISNYDKSYFFSHNFAGWGFGTWVDTHNKLTKKVYTKSYCRRVLFNPINVFNLVRKRGLRIILSLYRCYKNNQIHWDTFLTVHQFLSGKYSVFPTLTKVRNLGQDGSGQNSVYSESNLIKYSKQKLDTDCLFNPPEEVLIAENKEIEQLILKHFNVNHYSCKKNIMKFIKKGLC